MEEKLHIKKFPINLTGTGFGNCRRRVHCSPELKAGQLNPVAQGAVFTVPSVWVLLWGVREQRCWFCKGKQAVVSRGAGCIQGMQCAPQVMNGWLKGSRHEYGVLKSRARFSIVLGVDV